MKTAQWTSQYTAGFIHANTGTLIMSLTECEMS